MISIYRCLLKLYPSEHRRTFAEEMLGVFVEAEREVKDQGIYQRAIFYVREVSGLAGGAVLEQFHEVDLCRRQRLEMEGRMVLQLKYRFPRSAILMMTFVLVIVLGMIVKIQGVSHFYGKTITGQLPHIPWQWPSHYGLISGIVVYFLLAWIAGLAAWAIAYAMHRTAAQQLANLDNRS